MTSSLADQENLHHLGSKGEHNLDVPFSMHSPFLSKL